MNHKSNVFHLIFSFSPRLALICVCENIYSNSSSMELDNPKKVTQKDEKRNWSGVLKNTMFNFFPVT